MGGRAREGGSRAKPGNQLVYIYTYESVNLNFNSELCKRVHHPTGQSAFNPSGRVWTP